MQQGPKLPLSEPHYGTIIKKSRIVQSSTFFQISKKMAGLPPITGFPGDSKSSHEPLVSPSHKRMEHREAAAAHYHRVHNDEEKQQQEHGFSNFVAFCFTINFIVGVGILGIPHAMVNAGFVVSVSMLSVVCVICWMSAQWLLEALARTHAIVHYIESMATGFRKSFDKEQYLAEQERLFAGDHGHDLSGRSNGSAGAGKRKYKPVYEIDSERVIEVSDMFDVILGPRWKNAYKLVLGLFIFGTIWSYASVFGTSMAARIPIDIPGIGLVINGGETCDIYTNLSSGCNSLYWFYLILFACIVVPLTCMDLKDQQFFQVLLSICRFAMIGMIIGTVSYGANQNISHGGSFGVAPLPTAPASGVLAFIPVAVFAQIYHHSISPITQHLREKHAAPKVFGAAMLCCTILYAVLGVLVGSYYGIDVVASCVINWTKPNAPGALWIRSIIVLFPAFDILSAYPLNAITLAGNLRSKREQISWKQKIAIRILVASLPIIGAGVLHDLNEILKWIGLVGLGIGFIFPAILNIATKKKCFDLFVKGGDHKAEDQYVHRVLESSPMLGGRLPGAPAGPHFDGIEQSKSDEHSASSLAHSTLTSPDTNPLISPASAAEPSPLSSEQVGDLMNTPYTSWVCKDVFVYGVLGACPILLVLIIIITAQS
jgi:amino acid permease